MFFQWTPTLQKFFLLKSFFWFFVSQMNFLLFLRVKRIGVCPDVKHGYQQNYEQLKQIGQLTIY